MAAGLPIKPSQVQSHCVAGHRFFFPSLRGLSFPFPSGLLVAWGSGRPRCLLGMARKGSPWASRAASQAWASACSETTQPSVQVTGVGGGRGVGSSAPRSQTVGDVTASYPGRAWKEEGLPNSVSRLLLLLSVHPLGFPKAIPCSEREHPLPAPSDLLKPPSASECCTRIFIAYFEVS